MTITKRHSTRLIPPYGSNVNSTFVTKRHTRKKYALPTSAIKALSIMTSLAALFLLIAPTVPNMMPTDTSSSHLKKNTNPNAVPLQGVHSVKNGTSSDANNPPLDDSKTKDYRATKKINTVEQKDIRMQIKRPFMESSSHTFIDSMYDIERRYKPKPECDEWGNTKFIQKLNETAKSLLHDGTSRLISFHNKDTDIYFAENVSVVFTPPANGKSPSFRLEMDGAFLDANDVRSRMKHHKRKTHLTAMTMNAVEKQGLDECSEFIEYPVLLVDSDIDSWNWWFYLKTVLHHYIAVAMVQPMISGNYEQEAMRVLFASPDDKYSRSFFDSFDFMFSDRRGRDSRQIWNAAGNSGGEEQTKRLCFRKLLWTPGASTSADKILVNHQHKQSECFSSIVYSYAAHLKAAMHIPTLPRPLKPRVVFVARDQSKGANKTGWQRQRIINNQAEVIAALKDKCNQIGVELIVADFYGEKGDSAFQEQAVFVSKANIMIGMHGAGLNMFHFMPFNSVVVEIHRGTQVQKNSKNFVNHVKEARYISVEGRGGQNLEIGPIWETLQRAIHEWEELGKNLPN